MVLLIGALGLAQKVPDRIFLRARQRRAGNLAPLKHGQALAEPPLRSLKARDARPRTLSLKALDQGRAVTRPPAIAVLGGSRACFWAAFGGSLARAPQAAFRQRYEPQGR